jgi:two-component system LytT family response regulator
MKKAIIIDDEPLARSLVLEYLKDYPQITVAEECNNGFEGLKAIKEHHPDLIFLDVQMPKITGFEMLELLDQKPEIIFTTAFEEYAIKAFEAHAVDYLLKPFDQERFNKAVDKFLQNNHIAAGKVNDLLEEVTALPGKLDRVVVKTGNKIKIIPLYEIHCLEADDDYVNIHTSEGAFLKNKTMAFFEKTLNEKEFVRVHRSFIVKLDQVTKIEPYEKDGHVIWLKSGMKIPVSKSGYPKLRSALGL